MHIDLEKTIRSMGYLTEQDYDYWLRNLRQFFNRVGLRSREVRFIHGLCRQVMRLTDQLTTLKGKKANKVTGPKASN